MAADKKTPDGAGEYEVEYTPPSYALKAKAPRS